MKTLTIGAADYDLKPDADAYAALAAATGCSAAEIRDQLARGAHPMHLARALQPMLAGELTLVALAEMIADDDVEAVRAQVVAALPAPIEEPAE